MDPVSLLAELYADGRATAEKLRDGGLCSLEDICAKDPRDLARLLKIPRGLAQKIHSEAQEMLRGKSLEPAGRRVQPPRKSGTERSAGSKERPATPEPAAEDFKTQVVDLVAKYFR